MYTIIKGIITFIFSSALFINALLFIPQAVKIYKQKSAASISISTFVGFLLIQISVILYGFIQHDHLLAYGYLLSVITCGTVIGLAFFYKKNNFISDEINFEEIIEKLPWHVYWKNKDGILKGCNTQNWRDLGLNSLEEFIGKTDYDFLTKEQGDKIRETDIRVMKEGKSLIIEEDVVNEDGTNRLYLSYKLPLKNNKNEVLGILGISLDITDTRRQEVERLALLENVIALTPGHVYWIDKNNIYLGCNDNQAISAGLTSRKEIIGKKNEDLPWNHRNIEIAQSLNKANRQVMETGKPVVIEEPAILPNGSEVLFLSNKVPLRNMNQEVIGMVGISIDITDQKKIETELKTKTKEQQKFVNIANQVAHDIRSPLSSLLMIVKSCAEIPEQYRIALREAAISIGDIANNLLNTYKNPNATENLDENEKTCDVLVSALLMEILTEKKYQYHDLNIKFDFDFEPNSYFAFMKIKPSLLRRAISNIVNNAVDALQETSNNKIIIKLQANNEFIKIIIEDNGKGMPPDIVEKILSNVSVTSGKKGGHGIGLTQVRETLQNHQGEIDIISTPNLGTQMILTFPRIKSPNWIADEIRLNPDDIVIILDDDMSIHGAWNTHFDPVLAKHINMKIHHFDLAESALVFLNHINKDDLKRVFLLTDFELLKQELTGLHVVEKSKVTRSILVTSHYANKEVLANSAKTNTKILPKQLASEIPIYINEIESKTSETNTVDVVLVDDNKVFIEDLKMFVFRKLKVDTYHHPQHFLDHIHLYALDTKIYLDCNFEGTSIRGTDVAQILHEKGFVNIYLLSGERFSKDEIPSYVNILFKDDVDAIADSLK